MRYMREDLWALHAVACCSDVTGFEGTLYGHKNKGSFSQCSLALLQRSSDVTNTMCLFRTL